MTSRWPELLRLLLAALLEALWLGALGGRVGGRRPPPPTPYRLALLASGFGVAAALIAAAAPHGAGQIVGVVVRSLVFVGVSLELGLLAGRAEIDPERAFKRAVRAFALVFAVVLVSYAAGEPIAGSGLMVALVVLAGLALVAVARVLVTLQAIEGERSAWRWTAGVVLAGALALALAALIAAAPAGGALAWFGGLVIVALHALLDAVGYAIAAAGYAVVRALAALLGLLHVHLHHLEVRPPSTRPFKVLKQPQGQPRSGVPGIVGVFVLIALGLLAVRLLLRSFRIERDSVDETAAEEHEQLVRPAAEMRAAGRRLVGRLARLVGGGRPRTPAEALRAEYRRLERALGKSGFAREPSWSVRRYLGSLPAVAGAGGIVDGAPVARLIILYERARYGSVISGIDWPEVDEFRQTWRALQAADSR